VDTSKCQRTGKDIKLLGFSSIFGIPVPNSGFYDGIPVDLVLTSLNHLSNIIESLFNIFNCRIPNSIITRETLNTPLIISHQQENHPRSILPIIYSENVRDSYRTFISSPLNNLLLNKMKRHNNNNSSSSSSSRDFTINHEFYSHSMALLNENVMFLCDQLEIPKNELWPPNAILLNLNQIYLYCRKYFLHNITNRKRTEEDKPHALYTNYFAIMNSLSSAQSSIGSRNNNSNNNSEHSSSHKIANAEMDKMNLFKTDVMSNYIHDLKQAFLDRFSFQPDVEKTREEYYYKVKQLEEMLQMRKENIENMRSSSGEGGANNNNNNDWDFVEIDP
jgi:hypothetical protein